LGTIKINVTELATLKDALFYSLAEYADGKFIGAVLSGGLDDGLLGLSAIRRAGGITMVVTPRRSPDRSRPRNAISFNDPVDFIGSPRHIGAEIIVRVWRQAIGVIKASVGQLSYPTGPSQRTTMNRIEEELLLRRKSPEL
jgi:hypothetical protein